MAKGSYCHAKGSDLFTGEVGGPIRTTGFYNTVRYKFNDAPQLPLTSVWCGANRFEHAEVTRHDPVLKELFAIKTMANFKAIMRLFKRFTQQDNDRISGQMYRWMFDHLKLDGLTLNLDSTVMNR